MRLPIALGICLAAVPAHAGQDAWACSTAMAELQHDAQQLDGVTARGKAMLGRPVVELCPTLTQGIVLERRIVAEIRRGVARCGYIEPRSMREKIDEAYRLGERRYAALCPSSHRARRL